MSLRRKSIAVLVRIVGKHLMSKDGITLFDKGFQDMLEKHCLSQNQMSIIKL